MRGRASSIATSSICYTGSATHDHPAPLYDDARISRACMASPHDPFNGIGAVLSEAVTHTESVSADRRTQQ